MKATEECYQCLGGLVRQAANLATEDPDLKSRATEEGLKLLDKEFSVDKVSITIATPLHRLVKALTGNTDPYSRIKEAEIEMSKELRRMWETGSDDDIRSCLVLAVRGNSIDFFKDLKDIREDVVKPVEFAIDTTEEMEKKLKGAKSILYLADNAGEVFFDLPLFHKLEKFAPVTYVVKESPVQDDTTLADLKRFGLIHMLPRVITTGTDTPGVDMALASPQFKAEFEAADLVLAKGMGFWETLSELPARGKVFHLLKAKCRPVADSLGVALDSYVALLR